MLPWVAVGNNDGADPVMAVIGEATLRGTKAIECDSTELDQIHRQSARAATIATPESQLASAHRTDQPRCEDGALPERRPRGSPADGAGAVEASRPGHDQAARGGRGSATLDLLPHVPGDGDHGVSVERGDARARAADHRARFAENDEALRPDGGHHLARRDRAHRDRDASSSGEQVALQGRGRAVRDFRRVRLRRRPRSAAGTRRSTTPAPRSPRSPRSELK